MPANYTVEKVSGPEAWTHKASGNVNHDFKLRLTGFEHPVVLTQQPKTPAPEVGQSLSLDIVGDHPIHAGFKKVKKGEQLSNGQRSFGGGGKGDFHAGTQSAVKSAVAYAAAFTNPPSADDVILVAKQFFAAMEEMERGDG